MLSSIRWRPKYRSFLDLITKQPSLVKFTTIVIFNWLYLISSLSTENNKREIKLKRISKRSSLLNKKFSSMPLTTPNMTKRSSQFQKTEDEKSDLMRANISSSSIKNNYDNNMLATNWNVSSKLSQRQHNQNL